MAAHIIHQLTNGEGTLTTRAVVVVCRQHTSVNSFEHPAWETSLKASARHDWNQKTFNLVELVIGGIMKRRLVLSATSAIMC